MIAAMLLVSDSGLLDTGQVEVYAPPILGCVFGVPIVAVLVWFFVQLTFPDRPDED